MKNMNILQKEYILAAEAHGAATLEGDYEAANKQYAKLTKYYKELEKNGPNARSFLEDLFQHRNASVRVWAAAHALGLGVQTDEAQRVLQQLSEDHKIGIIRLDAEMTLKQWTKNGRLKF